MTENNINDLRKARYMSLSCPPASPEAKSLVNDIINIIAKSEKRQRARKVDEVPVFKSAVGLIIGDLLIGFQIKEAGWSYLSILHGISGYPLPERDDIYDIGGKTEQS